MREAVSEEFGYGGAVAVHARTALLRLILMAAIALMLQFIGGWSLAAPWFVLYALVQGILAWADGGEDGRRMSQSATLGLYALNFAIAGAPSWFLWTECGPLGIAAAIMFLCGMLLHLVVGARGAASLFWAGASPLVAYLVLVPPLAFGLAHPVSGLAGSACALLFVCYMAVLWRAHQRALIQMEDGRARAVELKKQAEAASQAKQDFLAVMSHEVRTPMNAVLGAADLLRRTELNQEQAAQLDMIANAGAVLMQVLNDVLDLSKIEAGKLSIDPTTIDLHRLVERCVQMWRPRAEERGLDFTMEMDPDTPRFVVMDALRTGQVLFNLLSNAMKFTAAGQVVVRLGARPLDDGRRQIEIAVTDTGAGIEPEALGRLFTAFEQADTSISRRFGGTGLGLTISQSIAGMMGGVVTVESVPGQGSTFVLSLPAPVAEPFGPSDEMDDDLEAQLPAARGLRILVAEDHPANQRIVEMFLRPLAASITITNDGVEALEALATQPFDIVLMDMQMPRMGGLDAVRQLRASGGPNAAIPVLALTAHVMEAQRRECMEAGMDGHVGKPIDSRELLSSIFSVLETSRAGHDEQKVA